MRKPSNKFFNLLNEAIKKSNPYGIDYTHDRSNPVLPLKELEKKDYSIQGEYKKIPDQFLKERKDKSSNYYSQAISEKNAIKKQIDLLKKNLEQPALVQQKIEIETGKVHEMQKDMLELSKQIADLKVTNTKYQNKLRHILNVFFSVPGAKIAKRYLILPLKNNVTINQINALNLNRKGLDLDEDLLKSQEYLKDESIDNRIKSYLMSIGYDLADEDFYKNVCYNKNKVKCDIIDELNKIKKIDITEKEKFLNKTRDLAKKQIAQLEIDKKKMYDDEFIKRMELISTGAIKDKNSKDINVIVLTWIPRMIMSQSTTTLWTSCMRLADETSEYDGGNVHYIPTSIENGVFIAWLVNLKDSTTIKKPLARILIKPFTPNRDSESVIWWPGTVYYDGSANTNINIFKTALFNFCYKKQTKEIRKFQKKEESSPGIDLSSTEGQYPDERDLKIRTMKEIFKNILEQKGRFDNFFDAADFSEKKAMFYLNKMPKMILNIYASEFLLYSLQKNNLNFFEYFAKIASLDDRNNVLKRFLKSYIKTDNYRYNFFTYIMKYYFKDFSSRQKCSVIMDLFEFKKPEILNFVVSNPMFMEAMFSDKNTDYDFLLEISWYISDNDKKLFHIFSKTLEYLMDTNNKNYYLNNTVNFFVNIESNYNVLDKKMINLYEKFYYFTVKQYPNFQKDYLNKSGYLLITPNVDNKIKQKIINSIKKTNTKIDINVFVDNSSAETDFKDVDSYIDDGIVDVNTLNVKVTQRNYKLISSLSIDKIKHFFKTKKEENKTTYFKTFISDYIYFLFDQKELNFEKIQTIYLFMVEEFLEYDFTHNLADYLINYTKHNAVEVKLETFKKLHELKVLEPINFFQYVRENDSSDKKAYLENLRFLSKALDMKNTDIRSKSHSYDKYLTKTFSQSTDEEYRTVLMSAFNESDFINYLNMSDHSHRFEASLLQNDKAFNLMYKNKKDNPRFIKNIALSFIDIAKRENNLDSKNYKKLYEGNYQKAIADLIHNKETENFKIESIHIEKILNIFNIKNDEYYESEIFKEILELKLKQYSTDQLDKIFNISYAKFDTDVFIEKGKKILEKDQEKYIQLLQVLFYQDGAMNSIKSFDKILYNLQIDKTNIIEAESNISKYMELIASYLTSSQIKRYNMTSTDVYKMMDMEKILLQLLKLIKRCGEVDKFGNFSFLKKQLLRLIDLFREKVYLNGLGQGEFKKNIKLYAHIKAQLEVNDVS